MHYAEDKKQQQKTSKGPSKLSTGEPGLPLKRITISYILKGQVNGAY